MRRSYACSLGGEPYVTRKYLAYDDSFTPPTVAANAVAPASPMSPMARPVDLSTIPANKRTTTFEENLHARRVLHFCRAGLRRTTQCDGLHDANTFQGRRAFFDVADSIAAAVWDGECVAFHCRCVDGDLPLPTAFAVFGGDIEGPAGSSAPVRTASSDVGQLSGTARYVALASLSAFPPASGDAPPASDTTPQKATSKAPPRSPSRGSVFRPASVVRTERAAAAAAYSDVAKSGASVSTGLLLAVFDKIERGALARAVSGHYSTTFSLAVAVMKDASDAELTDLQTTDAAPDAAPISNTNNNYVNNATVAAMLLQRVPTLWEESALAASTNTYGGPLRADAFPLPESIKRLRARPFRSSADLHDILNESRTALDTAHAALIVLSVTQRCDIAQNKRAQLRFLLTRASFDIATKSSPGRRLLSSTMTHVQSYTFIAVFRSVRGASRSVFEIATDSGQQVISAVHNADADVTAACAELEGDKLLLTAEITRMNTILDHKARELAERRAIAKELLLLLGVEDSSDVAATLVALVGPMVGKLQLGRTRPKQDAAREMSSDSEADDALSETVAEMDSTEPEASTDVNCVPVAGIPRSFLSLSMRPRVDRLAPSVAAATSQLPVRPPLPQPTSAATGEVTDERDLGMLQLDVDAMQRAALAEERAKSIEELTRERDLATQRLLRARKDTEDLRTRVAHALSLKQRALDSDRRCASDTVAKLTQAVGSSPAKMPLRLPPMIADSTVLPTQDLKALIDLRDTLLDVTVALARVANKQLVR